MNWSFPIARIGATTIRIHLTFLVLVVWIAIAEYSSDGLSAAFDQTALILLLFTCVVLHELGHALAARRHGIKTPDITLLPIGGIARLERMPENPAQELEIALAGPLVNLGIAALLFVILGRFDVAAAFTRQEAPQGLLESLASINLGLALFNLIPAFPMDGGRVLRAILAQRLGHPRGTEIAASVGQAVAFGLGLIGLLYNPLLIFVALMVYLGASSEAYQVQLRNVARGLAVADAAITEFHRLAPEDTLDDAADAMLRTTQHEFPVVDHANRIRGMLMREDLIAALRQRGPRQPVAQVMRTDLPALHLRRPLAEALGIMQETGAPAVLVTDGQGLLIGYITPENLGELMMVGTTRILPAPPGSAGASFRTRLS